MIMLGGMPRWASEKKHLAAVAADLAAHAVRWSSPETAERNVIVAASVAADWERVADRHPVRPQHGISARDQAITMAEAAARSRQLATRSPANADRATYAELAETLHWWAQKASDERGGDIHAILDFNLARAAERAAAELREAA